MLLSKKDVGEKRAELQKQLRSGKLLQFPGAYSPLVAMLIEQKGFDGVYISGAVVAADLGLPDIGLTTASEVVARGQQIAGATDLPCLIDMDTGFGEVANVARTVGALERAGIAGAHLEDQAGPKRCGHLDGKQLITTKEMCQKIKAALQSLGDSNFLLIARTDARAVEGLGEAIERAKAYLDAGAQMIFPEALEAESEFAAFRKALGDAPLLANMTEFGKSPLLNQKQLQDLGYNAAIYPVTLLRLAMKSAEQGLDHIKKVGDQSCIARAHADPQALVRNFRLPRVRTI